jgi:DNA replication protein DnaC
MAEATAKGRNPSTPGSASPSKPTIEEHFKSEQEVFVVMTSCGVPARFLAARKEEIPQQIWKLVDGFLSGESYFLHGQPGVGKTHIAVALMREMIVSDNEKIIVHPGLLKYYLPTYPKMATVPDLLLEIRECFNTRSDETEKSLIEKYAGKKCLVLDDLGPEKSTDWSIQTLYSIIDRRYRDMRQTLITSNLALDEIAEKVGDRIASRIAGLCRVVEIKGKDRRLKN